jgi:hypothetical protein
MRYIYTLKDKRITIDADNEIKAAQSFAIIAKEFFPENTKTRWQRETQEFYNAQEIAAKTRFMNQRKTATIKARAPVRKEKQPRVIIKPFHFE